MVHTIVVLAVRQTLQTLADASQMPGPAASCSGKQRSSVISHQRVQTEEVETSLSTRTSPAADALYVYVLRCARSGACVGDGK
jgi:hypothetical protein